MLGIKPKKSFVTSNDAFIYKAIMIHRLKLLIITIIITLTLTSFTIPKYVSNWVITQHSALIIKGSTNVNKFSCSILNYPKTDTITITKVNDLIQLSGKFGLKVSNFECNNLMMTNQFRNTLKNEEFPLLYITFISLKEIPSANQPLNQVKGLVAITIAGVTKRFEICYKFESLTNSFRLIGSQNINFSDFKLTPPQRVGKLIKANDELKVDFELRLKLAEG